MKKKLSGPNGLYVELDKSQVFPEDPGQGTPAMCYLKEKGCIIDSGTFFAASDTGELSDKGTQLNPTQCEWLINQWDNVNDFLYET